MNTGSNPEDKHYSIGEASSITGIKQTVLRYWQTEFSILHPRKNKFGHRVYFEEDIQTILKIKNLLYEKGMTIKGAKKELTLKSNKSRKISGHKDEALHSIRKKLLEVKALLKQSKGYSMDIQGRNDKEIKLIKEICEKGHETIFTFWNELSDDDKDTLIGELSTIDFAKIDEYLVSFNNQEKSEVTLDPTPYLSIKDYTDDKNIFDIGTRALANNEVAFVTVAGGQGSRLGYEHPKGCYSISPVKKKSLFQLFAEKIKFYTDYYKVPFKWYIMTSIINYDETVSFFKENNYFGLQESSITFFKQGMLPTLTLDGKLILKEKGRLFQNPDGHGGILKALMVNGLLDEMEKNGVKYISYFQVDNPLVLMADPYFIGYHIKEKSKVASKVIAKKYPEEKLGSIGKINNINGIIEYSDLPEDKMHQKNADGVLEYLMGSIAIHVFDVAFLKKFTDKLPIHFAKKNVKGYTFDGDSSPAISDLDGLKFEMFVFDTIPLADISTFFETDREEEFYPLKNKTGVDSIETCIDGQKKMHFSWLREAGLVTEEYTGQTIEISPLYAPDRKIFINKAKKDADTLKKELYDDNGQLKTEIYIEG